MTTKERIEEAASLYLSKLNKKYNEIEQANMPNIICEEAYTKGAEFGIQLEFERTQKLVEVLHYSVELISKALAEYEVEV